VCTFKTFQPHIKKKYAVDLHEYQLDSPTEWNVALLSTASGIFDLIWHVHSQQLIILHEAWRDLVLHVHNRKKEKNPSNLLEFLECVWNQITDTQFTFDTNTNGKCKIQFLRS